MLYIQILVLLFLITILFLPTIEVMIWDWENNANYSHGYLIPFITGFMIFSMRKELSRLEPAPSNWGLLLIVYGMLQLIVARVVSENFLQRTSLLFLIYGLVLFLLGKAITRRLNLPIVFLAFMIPIPPLIWNTIAFPMQIFASTITEKVISVIGIPVLREGNVLHLSQTSLEVVDACSGLRSLVSMMALSAAFAFFIDISKTKKWILFFSAFPIAIIVNVIRLTITAGLASKYGEKVAQGFLHDASGFIIFGLGLLLLYGVSVLLSKWKNGEQTEPK